MDGTVYFEKQVILSMAKKVTNSMMATAGFAALYAIAIGICLTSLMAKNAVDIIAVNVFIAVIAFLSQGLYRNLKN